MANGWAPRNGDELISDIYQRLRILQRHRHPQNFGEIAGSIDASGGHDISPVSDYYVEGQDQDYAIPDVPDSTSTPPSGEDSSPVPDQPADTTAVSGTVQGVGRAEATTMLHTTGGGASLLVPSVWAFSNLYGSPGAALGSDDTNDARFIASGYRWYEITAYASINWASAQTDVKMVLDWQDRPGTFQPVHKEPSGSQPYEATLASGKFWLPSSGWMTLAFTWASTTAPSSVSVALDVAVLS